MVETTQRSPEWNALAGLLVDVAADRRPADVRRVLSLPLPEVLAASDLHRITPAVHRQLRDLPGVPQDWMRAFAHRRHEQVMRHLRAVEDLKVAANAMDDAGIPWVAVKGPVLAEQIWPSPSMRQYMDLDLVVDRHRFTDALAVLRAAGIEQLDRNWPMLAATMRAEVAMQGRFGTVIDLHWDIAVPRQLRRDFRVDVGGMLSRARPIGLRDDSVRVKGLDPVDTVLHLVFHAAQAGAHLLVWLADIRFAVQQDGFDWSELERRACAARFDMPTALVIARADRTLGLDQPMPEWVRRRARSIWGGIAERRERRHPFPGLPGEPHIGGNLYTAARNNLPLSAARLVRSALEVRRIEARERAGKNIERELELDVPDAVSQRSYLDTTELAARP